MSRRPYDWRQRISDRDVESERHAAPDDIARWIASYFEGAREDGHEADGGRGRPGRWGRRAGRGPAPFVNLDDLFEDIDGESVWPEELHEHLSALRDRLHGISAQQHDGRRRGRHARWGRRRDAASAGVTDGPRRASDRSRRIAWAVVTRLAVIAITALMARRRAERSRRRRGFSV